MELSWLAAEHRVRYGCGVTGEPFEPWQLYFSKKNVKLVSVQQTIAELEYVLDLDSKKQVPREAGSFPTRSLMSFECPSCGCPLSIDEFETADFAYVCGFCFWDSRPSGITAKDVKSLKEMFRARLLDSPSVGAKSDEVVQLEKDLQDVVQKHRALANQYLHKKQKKKTFASGVTAEPNLEGLLLELKYKVNIPSGFSAQPLQSDPPDWVKLRPSIHEQLGTLQINGKDVPRGTKLVGRSSRREIENQKLLVVPSGVDEYRRQFSAVIYCPKVSVQRVPETFFPGRIEHVRVLFAKRPKPEGEMEVFLSQATMKSMVHCSAQIKVPDIPFTLGLSSEDPDAQFTDQFIVSRNSHSALLELAVTPLQQTGQVVVSFDVMVKFTPKDETDERNTSYTLHYPVWLDLGDRFDAVAEHVRKSSFGTVHTVLEYE